MRAGARLRVNVHRAIQGADDAVGGATYTESTVYIDLWCNITRNSRPQQEDDVELTTRSNLIFTCRAKIKDEVIDIKGRDFIEVIWPLEHPLIGQTMRVTGVNHSPQTRRNMAILKANLEVLEYDRKYYTAS